MLAGRSYRFTEFVFWTRRSIYALVVVATIPVFFYEVLGIKWLVMPWGVVLLLGTAVALMAGRTSGDRTKWFEVMGTPPLRQVMEGALGLPKEPSAEAENSRAAG